ncbi:MAG: ABC transporter permease, partial [Desulforhopalus sp.]
MAVLLLSIKSLKNRWLTVLFTIVSISLSIALFLSVERIRHEAQAGFTNTISGTDLIVGARTGPVQLLLASVFRLSDASNNISWHSYNSTAAMSQVKWAIPISLGDTHKGYRVLGTNENYYKHLQFGSKQHLSIEKGHWFADEHGAVIGAEVAISLGYSVGSEIVVSHGTGDISFINHDQHPFTVAGILERTGTPVDRTVHVSLAGINEIHAEITMGENHQHDPLAAHIGHSDHAKLGKGESPS